jgi:hypothetical protein
MTIISDLEGLYYSEREIEIYDDSYNLKSQYVGLFLYDAS